MKECIWKVKPEDRLCRYCKMVHCEDRSRVGARKMGTVTPRMRQMEVGGLLEIEVADHNAARTAAHRLSRENGAKFSIYTRRKKVYVERIH